MAGNRRALWVGAVLMVAIVSILVARSGDDPPPPSASRARPATARAGAQPAETLPPADVNLEALTASPDAPMDAGRNPFRFQAKPAPPAVPTRRVPGIPDDQVDAPPPPHTPAGPAPPPPIALKLIGIVQKADGTKIAVLSDGKRPISGGEGEEIEGRYKILKIGTESIEIAYIDGRGRRTIPLNGQ